MKYHDSPIHPDVLHHHIGPYCNLRIFVIYSMHIEFTKFVKFVTTCEDLRGIPWPKGLLTPSVETPPERLCYLESISQPKIFDICFGCWISPFFTPLADQAPPELINCTGTIPKGGRSVFKGSVLIYCN